MHEDAVAFGVKRACVAVVCLSVATLACLSGRADATVRAVAPAPIQPSHVGEAPVQPAGVSRPAAIQPAGTSVRQPAIKPTGTPGTAAPKLMEPDENDTDAERIRKLQSVAQGNPKRGSAAERTAARTAWLLGLLYLHGEHAPVDRALARTWFERARTLNEPLSNAGLAWCEIDGCTGAPSPGAARPYLAPLRNANTGLALFLDWKIQDRLAPVHGGNASQALLSDPDAQRLQLLQQAAQAGNASAFNELGLINVTASRYDLALQQFNKAAARSPAAASNAKLLSVRIEQNQTGASINSAAKKKSPDDWYEQARRYHRGDGVPSNYSEAIRLYQLAAAGGNAAARRMLELIYSRPAPGGSVNVAWMRQLASMDVTAEGAILNFSSPPTPVLYVRDVTPLYEFIPQEWRRDRSVGQK
ncbi:SEL1-like repeat protein [Diaphorobacter aerolatus]|uniref:SEL1-like repeat protein n=1 Tax=Diaphorobacter aerolatus TaxID=1288495 RepID=A0A7H0GKT0_9BURK|nr:SEL1-like repeat protein [Diaphorobacter aerolatus]QNP48896.1 SEL1-like repeat protein [Diaphorobacter aerolatus]